MVTADEAGPVCRRKVPYDPDAYPLDTTLDSILPQSAADDAYITASSVFAGDQYAVTLKRHHITLNQFVGQEGYRFPRRCPPPV